MCSTLIREQLVGEKEQHRVASSCLQTTHNSSAAPSFGLYESLVLANNSLSACDTHVISLCNDCGSLSVKQPWNIHLSLRPNKKNK